MAEEEGEEAVPVPAVEAFLRREERVVHQATRR